MGARNRSILIIAVAFIIGLLVGWIVLGWWLFPVQWGGTLAQDLQPADKKMIIDAEAEAFALTRDAGTAIARLQTLGTQAQVAQLASELVQDATSQGDLGTADQVTQLAVSLGLVLPAVEAPSQEMPQETPGAPTPAPTPDSGAQEQGGSLLPTLLGVLLLGGGIALAAWLLLRRKEPKPASGKVAQEPGEPAVKPVVAPVAPLPDRPIAPGPDPSPDQAGREYSAIFHQGDVDYDQSFDIEASDGSYWGECGLTVSELVNGDPNRVTALEVWLFDKSDIRTVTKVLMTDFAYGNQALRDKLSSKGDALLLSPDMGFVLDAQTLRLMGKVLALEYDDGDGPPRSTIRKLSVQLRVLRQAG
jgi:hypothetical protein